MKDNESTFNFAPLEDDEELDLDAIFGAAASEPTPPPPIPMQAEAKQEAAPDNTAPAKTQDAPVAAEPLELFPAFTAQEAPAKEPVKDFAPRPQTQVSLFDKPPVFQYGSAREPITDTELTFDALRIQKSEDFPELEERSAVSWQMRYGDITKAVTSPKTATILSMKREIEQSKAFLDSLKKGKCKNTECLVKPSVTMQKKGIADYKGVFPTLEAARASNKVICLIPARDGQVYELRRSELGEFLAPKTNITEFSQIRAGFRPALPRIPQSLLCAILGFFRSQMTGGAEFEALVRIYWDRQEKRFVPYVPRQQVSKDCIRIDLSEETLPDENRYLYYADIHSHNSMKAVFSAIDDMDERGTQLYLVVGHLDSFYPEIAARISCGGSFVPIEPKLVLEPLDADFPEEWCDKVRHELPALPSAQPSGFRSFLGSLLAGGAG